MTSGGITISEKTIGIWRVELPGGNWLAHLSHNDGAAISLGCGGAAGLGATQAWLIATLAAHIVVYRFRWDRGGREERPWAISGLPPGSADEEAIEKVREAQDNLMTYGLGGWELLRGERSPAEFSAALRQMPGMTTTAGIGV